MCCIITFLYIIQMLTEFLKMFPFLKTIPINVEIKLYNLSTMFLWDLNLFILILHTFFLSL